MGMVLPQFSPLLPQQDDFANLQARIIDRTVWLQTQDFRERKQPKAFIWSLDLRSVLTR